MLYPINICCEKFKTALITRVIFEIWKDEKNIGITDGENCKTYKIKYCPFCGSEIRHANNISTYYK